MRLTNKSLFDIYIFVSNLLLSPLRKFKLQIQARLNGGRIVIGKNIRFHHPICFQGKGTIVIKDHVTFGYHLAGSNDNRIILQARFADSEIIIGEHTQIMNGCELFSTALISIGNHVLLGAGVKIMDSNFHDVDPLSRMSPGESSPVLIHNNCWVGIDVLLLKGSEVGENTVIAAKSLVRSHMESNSIYGGNPARLIKKIC
jgi:acetyltransferase-like isoleucine patch superfamily enzyme